MKKSNFLFFISLIWIVLLFIYSPKIYERYRTFYQLKKQLNTLNSKSIKLDNELNKLNTKLSQSSNLYYIEKYVRDKLFMKKKGETIYRVIYEEK